MYTPYACNKRLDVCLCMHCSLLCTVLPADTQMLYRQSTCSKSLTGIGEHVEHWQRGAVAGACARTAAFQATEATGPELAPARRCISSGIRDGAATEQSAKNGHAAIHHRAGTSCTGAEHGSLQGSTHLRACDRTGSTCSSAVLLNTRRCLFANFKRSGQLTARRLIDRSAFISCAAEG